jgi:hypothetical protein
VRVLKHEMGEKNSLSLKSAPSMVEHFKSLKNALLTVMQGNFRVLHSRPQYRIHSLAASVQTTVLQSLASNGNNKKEIAKQID